MFAGKLPLMAQTAAPVAAAKTRLPWIVILLGWTFIVPSALFIPISLLTLAMVVMQSHGTASATLSGFVLVVLVPPTILAAGIGLLLRQKWALIYLAIVLFFLVVYNSINLVNTPTAPQKTVSPSGVTTTITPPGRMYVIQNSIFILICTGLLVVLLTRKVRLTFGLTSRSSADALSASSLVSSNRPAKLSPERKA